MTFSANGKPRSAPPGTTIADLLADAELEALQVFIEYNGAPLERSRYATTAIKDGDRIEVAQMVGGG